MSASTTLVPALNSTVPPTHDSDATSASSAVSPSSSNPTAYPHLLPHSSPSPTAASTADSLAALTSNIPNSAHSLPPLPAPAPMANPAFAWGSLSAENFIKSVSSAYAEVVHWRRNTFPVPSGNAGKKFVNELSTLYSAYAEGSALECIALKAITVMSLLLLQKPHNKSKPKEHSACLERRLLSWTEGDIDYLLLEGRTIQNRLPTFHQSESSNAKLARTFSNLMFQGKTSAALELLAQKGRGGIMRAQDPVDASDPDSPSVLDILKSKHPRAQPASPISVPQVSPDFPVIHPVVFDQIDASSIRSAALRTKGAAGPSGIDAHGWRRLCTSFKAASMDLCHSLAQVARRLCTSFVDPEGLSALLACRLIALDKCPGVRPIGICETARRIISKAVLQVTRTDLQDAAGSLQLCAGQIAGIEAAVHSMKEAFSSEGTEAVLLVDASNAFNALNRDAALHNIRHLCPVLSTILINIYRESTELFVDGLTLASVEGTTQGDPLAMPMYALATIPLINCVGDSLNIVQVWYADDASAAGDLSSIRSWWDNISSYGPAFGYHANASKTWLVTKEVHLAKAKEIFQNTNSQVASVPISGILFSS